MAGAWPAQESSKTSTREAMVPSLKIGLHPHMKTCPAPSAPALSLDTSIRTVLTKQPQEAAHARTHAPTRIHACMHELEVARFNPLVRAHAQWTDMLIYMTVFFALSLPGACCFCFVAIMQVPPHRYISNARASRTPPVSLWMW
jgi:hypothetical protein